MKREIVTRIRAGGGARLERLEAHPVLPLVAGWDAEWPAVHVWSFDSGELRRLATVAGELAPYGDAVGWERYRRQPTVAWHPSQPLLLVVSEGTVRRWTPDGVSAMDGLPPAAAYRYLAFSPDGQTLWAFPSPEASQDRWRRPAMRSTWPREPSAQAGAGTPESPGTPAGAWCSRSRAIKGPPTASSPG